MQNYFLQAFLLEIAKVKLLSLSPSLPLSLSLLPLSSPSLSLFVRFAISPSSVY
jgi:hypothetical protein